MGGRTLLGALLLALAGPATARADVIHVYARGETLAALSERYYGSAAHEAVLVAANFLNLQQNPTLPTGVHLVIPSVSYHRVAPGDTWERLAQHLLGDGRRGPYLARINNGAFNLSPSAGAVIRVPYLLRYVVTSDEPVFEIARRFYGDRSLVQFITEFNLMESQRLQRGQVLILPLADVVLREAPATAGVTAPTTDPGTALEEAHASQLRVERDLPAFQQALRRGLYVEAVGTGSRLLGAADLSTVQRVAVDRGLAEAYAALDRRDLAAGVLRDALTADPTVTFDPGTTPPKVLDALQVARGGAPSQTVAPAPPTSRPDSAH